MFAPWHVRGSLHPSSEILALLCLSVLFEVYNESLLQEQPFYDLVLALGPALTSFVTTGANFLTSLDALKNPRRAVAPSDATPRHSPVTVVPPRLDANFVDRESLGCAPPDGPHHA